MKRRMMSVVVVAVAVVFAFISVRTSLGMGLYDGSGARPAAVPAARGGLGMYGPGMMGNEYGPGSGYGAGMMGGYGPRGTMQGWARGNQNGPAISIDQAQKDVQAYVAQLGNPDLAVSEVMEFQNNFYAIVKEKSTGLGAYEVLINKWTGVVTPEPGPNMMWNTKYGVMGQNSWMSRWMGYSAQTGAMTVSVDQAKQIAQRWLDRYQPGSTVETVPDTFYGYYTMHTLKQGKITGMLSVNGYSGQVWYHTWHGAFIQMKELGG